MGKQSGLGDNFYIDGYDVSGDISTLDGASQPLALLDYTGVDKFAHERVPGQAGPVPGTAAGHHRRPGRASQCCWPSAAR